MKKFIKGLGIVAIMCACTLTATAQDETQKEGFLKRAFRDMKESAKLQRKIDKANFQATKLEAKAFYEEQKRLSKPTVRSAAEKERMEKELEAANQRLEQAKAHVDSVMGEEVTLKNFVNYERGYRADIALSTSISEQYSITTSHGYSFGNGLYVGGGVGFTAETFLNFEDEPHYLVPLFADVKYSFLNKRVSPFVSARVGGIFNTEYQMNRMLINPMVGIDVRHFSIGLGYELQHNFKGLIENKASMHNVRLSVGYTF